MVDLMLWVEFGLEGCRGGLSSRSAVGVSSLWVCCCCHGFSLWVRFIAVVVGWVIDGGGRLAIVVVAVEFCRFGCCGYGYLSIYILDTQRETLH